MNALVPFEKVMFSTFWWENQNGTRRQHEPTGPTYLGDDVNLDAKLWRSEKTLGELMAEKGRKIDTWRPVLQLSLGYHRDRIFTGERALEMRKAFQAFVMSKKKRKDKK